MSIITLCSIHSEDDGAETGLYLHILGRGEDVTVSLLERDPSTSSSWISRWSILIILKTYQNIHHNLLPPPQSAVG